MFFTPRWIASHLFAATLIVAFVIAGFWQVNRLAERQDQNALVESRLGEVVALSNVADFDVGDLEFRRVQVEGSFIFDSQILIANRSREGTPGFWIWTTFRTDLGDLVVNRGFVSRDIVLGTAELVAGETLEPTAGQIVIEGLLREGFDDASLSEANDQLSRPDPATAAEVLGLDTALDSSIYLQLQAQEPPLNQQWPQVLPLPDLGEGPHRSYAFQWFTFATIGVIGYGLLLRRIKRGDQTRGDVPV